MDMERNNQLGRELLAEGCPFELDKPLTLYRRLNHYLDSIGQEDGEWARDGEIHHLALIDHPLAVELQKFTNRAMKAQTAVSPGLAALIDEHITRTGYSSPRGWAMDIWVTSNVGFMFAQDWKVFGFMCSDADGEHTIWGVRGVLFPDRSAGCNAIVWYALAEEVFPAEEAA